MRNCQSQRGGGLQVDDQLETGRLLDRQIRGFGALQDLVDERGGALEILSRQFSIRQQSAAINEFSQLIDCRQAILSGATSVC